MKKNKKSNQEQISTIERKTEEILSKNVSSLKDLIAPAGIDASKLDHMEIMESNIYLD